MLFNSIAYLVFLPVVVVLYFATPHRYRWVLLLAASYYFYMCWKVEYVFLILLSTAIDYVAGMRIASTDVTFRRRAWLIASLVSNLGILFAFKYFNFFSESARAVFERFDLFYDVPAFNVLLPVGISFYTFQSMSYTIDVYRREREPERHPGIFALYVAFFPQLVAGPIERSTRLIPQFFERHRFDYDRVVSGLRLILWGLFQKVVIADRLAGFVDLVYGRPHSYSGLPLLLATYFFAIQIYCDFAGYTDIARGSARILGFDLMENFRRPYLAGSIREFWGRWHVSLSTWFRDYLYVPLGGNRVTTRRWCANILIVFVLSGLWHGAEWTFVVWGTLHGVYLLAGRILAPIRERLVQIAGLTRFDKVQAALRVVVTFHLVLIGWVYFRAGSLSDAHYILRDLASVPNLIRTLFEFAPDVYWLERADLGPLALAYLMGLACGLIAIHYAQEKHELDVRLAGLPVWARWALYVAGALAILNMGAMNEVPFIYFQF